MTIKPFFVAIATAAIITYTFYPVYNWLQRVIKLKGLASILTIFFIIIIFVIPLSVIVASLSNQAVTGYSFITKVNNDIFEDKCESQSLLCKSTNYVKAIAAEQNFKEQLDAATKGGITFIVEKTRIFLLSLPGVMLNTFIVFFLIFYFFIDGKNIIDKVWDLIKLDNQDKEIIKKKVSDVSYAVIYGSFIVGLIQGTLMGVTYYFFGIKAAIFWGFVTVLASFVPFIGTGLIWGPASLYLILNGMLSSDVSGVFRGIGLFAVGALLISTVDNVVRPKIIGKKADVHPIVILLGVIGGFEVFGLVGIIIGPLVLALLVTFIEIYKKSQIEE